jgi:hypothetical protein
MDFDNKFYWFANLLFLIDILSDIKIKLFNKIFNINISITYIKRIYLILTLIIVKIFYNNLKFIYY